MSTPGEWDSEYRDGKWEILSAGVERLRYEALSARVLGGEQGSRKAVLDLGCGDGVLRTHLPSELVESYTGVDWSEEAVAQARLAGHERTSFHAASVVDWEPDAAYDAIVFNEVLYYLPDPVAVAERYATHLRSGGSIFVSMWCPSTIAGWRPARPSTFRARLGCWKIWRGLGRRFEVLSDSVVESSHIRRWKIQELRRRS
jgi:2-polyprenyl-3-methyl-5-hydroxy-6-metoxy-1,4-benzoquinol methylase